MKKLKPLNITNTLIKLIFFFAFPAAWATGFSGVKYLCEQIHSGKPLEMTAFLTAFIAIAGFTIVFGRFFCGRACAFGTYGDILHELAKLIAKKTHKKLPKLDKRAASRMRYIKYAVLIAVCLMCVFGKSSVVSGASPWTAFSNLRAGRIELGSALNIVGIVLFALISMCMLFVERFFCRFLCPFGAVFSLLPVLPVSSVSRDRSNCLKGCRACQSVCPAGLELPYYPVQTEEEFAKSMPEGAGDDEISMEYQKFLDEQRSRTACMGECFQCGRCIHMKNILQCSAKTDCVTMKAGTAGLVMDIVKAVILGVILYIVM